MFSRGIILNYLIRLSNEQICDTPITIIYTDLQFSCIIEKKKMKTIAVSSSQYALIDCKNKIWNTCCWWYGYFADFVICNVDESCHCNELSQDHCYYNYLNVFALNLIMTQP